MRDKAARATLYGFEGYEPGRPGYEPGRPFRPPAGLVGEVQKLRDRVLGAELRCKALEERLAAILDYFTLETRAVDAQPAHVLCTTR